MRSREDIDAYLVRSGRPHQEVQDGTWIVKDLSETSSDTIVHIEDELVLFRLKVMELSMIDEGRRAELFEALLRLNGSDMLHGAYGLTNGHVMITAAMPLHDLDYQEFQATLDDMTLAITKHFKQLDTFRSKGS
jgi:hypothetical protein